MGLIIENIFKDIFIIINFVLTIILWCKKNEYGTKRELEKQLIQIQTLSFRYPYLEDINYTKTWDDLRIGYLDNTISDSEKFLRYDSYTEMIFNYLYRAYEFYKDEKKLLSYVDFKSWLRNHKHCWQNPLIEHDNRDVYGDEFCDLVDKWMK